LSHTQAIRRTKGIYFLHPVSTTTLSRRQQTFVRDIQPIMQPLNHFQAEPTLAVQHLGSRYRIAAVTPMADSGQPKLKLVNGGFMPSSFQYRPAVPDTLQTFTVIENQLHNI